MSISKFKKALEKKEITTGFTPISDFINTGNASLNEIISGDMNKGIPVNRGSIFAGLNGSGKSFMLCNIAANAQKKGYTIVYIDTENSLSDGFAEKIGVITDDEEKFISVSMTTIEEVTEFVSVLFNTVDKDEKIGLIIDSLSNLFPERDLGKFDEGKIAYGQGLREKMLKQLVASINSRLNGRNMFYAMSTHMYVNGADHYGNPILKPNVGEGTLFLPSIVVQMTKRDLKDGKDSIGINIRCKTLKTRCTMLGKEAVFDLPWDRGMDFYDGALDKLESYGIVEKNGGWYKYINTETGEEVKFQRGKFEEHAEYLMEQYSTSVDEKDEADANIEMKEAMES